MYIDIHTHIPNVNKLSIYNLQPMQSGVEEYGGVCSIGIHPWYIPADFDVALCRLKEIVLKSNVVAVGECGLDKVCSTPFDLQTSIFKEQVVVSEEVKKPLIIHCVKSYAELLQIKKEYNPAQQWIVHGFRGNFETAQMLIRAGIIVSIGEKFNTEAVKQLPIEKIFIESDESTLPIEDIYRKVANVCELSEKELIDNIKNRYKYIFMQNAR